MKRLLVLLTAAVAASGCASVAQQASGNDDVDVQYVAAVERAAKQFGTQIVWINYPRKRTTQ